jgi:hypothetical protein
VEFKVSPLGGSRHRRGNVLGKADGGEKLFERPGKHLVQLSLSSYRTTWVEIVVDPAAADEVVEVDTVLPQQYGGRPKRRAGQQTACAASGAASGARGGPVRGPGQRRHRRAARSLGRRATTGR